MTLTLSRLGFQLENMGENLAAQERQQQRLLDEVERLLCEHSAAYESLRERASLAAERLSWHGAIPTAEALRSVHPLPPHPPRATLMAADGSQVEPDRHGVALYYLINIGSIVFEHGTGQRPRAESEPLLFFKREDLYEEKRLVQGNLLDIRRDTAELRKLADLAHLAASGPILALTDGTLLLWVLEETPLTRKQEKLRRYLDCLDELRRDGAAVAGFISRPRHGDVIDLLHLASLGDDLSSQRLENNPFEELTDRLLFSFLEPGERSALFLSAATVNADYRHHQDGNEICFFYLNVGDEGYAKIARVEVPCWVAKTSLVADCKPTTSGAVDQPLSWVGSYRLLDFVHAAIYQQCRVARGYPYILARAHELALVSVEERRDLEMRIIAALARRDLEARPSEKARLKELTGGGRRRHRI